VTGPSDFVEKKVAEFLDKQKLIRTEITHEEVSHPRAYDATGKRMSVAQFFKKVSCKSDVERVLAAGYFLEKFKNAENFTALEVREAIKEAKIPPPKNTNDSVNKNIKKGFMMTGGDKEGKMAFVLTTDGEEVVGTLINE
jgi:hypothetical protein